jgi:hypothetical protein
MSRARRKPRPGGTVEILADDEVRAMVDAGALVRLSELGPTPVDPLSIARLRARVERPRRRAGRRAA